MPADLLSQCMHASRLGQPEVHEALHHMPYTEGSSDMCPGPACTHLPGCHCPNMLGQHQTARQCMLVTKQQCMLVWQGTCLLSQTSLTAQQCRPLTAQQHRPLTAQQRRPLHTPRAPHQMQLGSLQALQPLAPWHREQRLITWQVSKWIGSSSSAPWLPAGP